AGDPGCPACCGSYRGGAAGRGHRRPAEVTPTRPGAIRSLDRIAPGRVVVDLCGWSLSSRFRLTPVSVDTAPQFAADVTCPVPLVPSVPPSCVGFESSSA